MAGRIVTSRATSMQRQAFDAVKHRVWEWDGTPEATRRMAEKEFRERPGLVLACYRAIYRSLISASDARRPR